MCDWTENNEECLPVSMKSGRVVSGSIETSISTKVAKMNRDAFLNKAKKAACKEGLSLFAVDLAIASSVAHRVIKTMFRTYGDSFLISLIANIWHDDIVDQRNDCAHAIYFAFMLGKASKLIIEK